MHVHLLYTCLTHSPTRGTIKCLMFSWERKWMALLLYTLLMCNYNSDEKRAIIIVLMRHSSFSLTHYWKALITMFSVTVNAWASVVNAQRCLGTFVQLEISHNCLSLLSLSNGITVFYWWSNDETDLFFDWLSWTVSKGVNENTITWGKKAKECLTECSHSFLYNVAFQFQYSVCVCLYVCMCQLCHHLNKPHIKIILNFNILLYFDSMQPWWA